MSETSTAILDSGPGGAHAALSVEDLEVVYTVRGVD